jgi:hypothetical protein
MATIRVRAKTRGFYRQVMSLPKDDRMLRPAGRHAKSVEVQKGDEFEIDEAAFSSTWMERVGVQDLERDAKAARAKADQEAKEAEAADKAAKEAAAKAKGGSSK